MLSSYISISYSLISGVAVPLAQLTRSFGLKLRPSLLWRNCNTGVKSEVVSEVRNVTFTELIKDMSSEKKGGEREQMTGHLCQGASGGDGVE